MEIQFRQPSDGLCSTLDGNRQDIIALLLDVPDDEIATVCVEGDYAAAADTVECCATVRIVSRGIR